MKSFDEVAQAHDALLSILHRDGPIMVKPEQEALIMAQVDVLCWLLEHEHNKIFQDNLDIMHKTAQALGYELIPIPKGHD